MAALTSTIEFHSDRLNYMLKAAIAKAGGTAAQAALFTTLLTNSLQGSPKASSESSKVSLQDCRAANSLLFTVPPYLQILLALILHQREEEIYTQFADRYELQKQILKPAEVIQINQAVTQNPIGATLLSLLNRPINRYELNLLLGLNLKADIFSSEIPFGRRLEILFEAYNLSSPFIDNFILIAVSNDRLKAAVIIAERLGYSLTDIQNIASVVELWLLENSST